MKIAGIVGGLGPESTIDYYRRILERTRARRPDGGAPHVVITSIDVQELLGLMNAGRLDDMASILVREVDRLARAGADFGAISANTPHIVFGAVRRWTQLPLLSIVEATRDAARARGLRRLALLGTRFTMQARFYPGAFEPAGIAIVQPNPAELEAVHDIYVNQLIPGDFRPESRAQVLDLVARMAARDGIDGAILGGTELPLLLRQPEHAGVPFLDTTALHVERIVDEILS